MRAALLSLFRFRYFVFGFVFFFFLALAPLNQSHAVGLGQGCVNAAHTPSITCDSGLYCDTSADSTSMCTQSGTCHGVCRSTCIEYQGGPVNGGCAANEVCQEDPGCTTYGCSGRCILDSSAHIPSGSYCTYTGSAQVQDNCVAGDICYHDSGVSGKGICYPANYTCNAQLDSRTNLITYSCPAGTMTCAEDHGKVPTLVDTGTAAGDQNVIQDCPGCTFSCYPKQEVTVTCKCNNPGNTAAKQNGYTCVDRFNKQVTSYCAANVACSNTPGAAIDNLDLQTAYGDLPKTGVTCVSVAEPAPPAPPCKDNIDVTGKCNTIVSSLGDIQTDPAGFITKLFGILLGAGGAIALILFIRAGYRIMTSRGNPEGIKEGREQIVAAIIGLMFIIFSFVILQVIGVDLLQLPGSSAVTVGGGGGGRPVMR